MAVILSENWSVICLLNYKWFCMTALRVQDCRRWEWVVKIICLAGRQDSRT